MPGLLDILAFLNSGASVGTRLKMLDMANRGGISNPEVRRGLLPTPEEVTTNPTVNDASGFLGPMAAAKLGGLLGAGVMTYHGTPHKFDKYDLSKIGTGEGNQVYGHGIYFAENPAVAQTYTAPESFAQMAARHKAGGTPKSSGGMLMKQDLPDEVLPKMLQWDKPLSEHPKEIKSAIKPLQDIYRKSDGQDGPYIAPDATGEQIYKELRKIYGESRATGILQGSGIPGVSYLDAGSRGAAIGTGTRNHVIWDQELLNRMLPQVVE